MKTFLIGLLAFGASAGAIASSFHCEDQTSGYALDVTLSGHGGMGSTRGTGDLTLSGQTVGTLKCVYTSGITTSLNCRNNDYQVSGAANLHSLSLFYYGQRLGTLTCE